MGRFLESNRYVFFSIFAAAFLAVTVATGSQHDYISYVRHWDGIWSGANPWPRPMPDLGNIYGPIHTLFAPLAAIHPLLPKVVLSLAWLAGQLLVYRHVRALTEAAAYRTVALTVIVLNPFGWVWVAGYGNNDALVAFFLALVVCQRRVGAGSPASSTALGLAALLKFYPLLLLPFVAIDRRRIFVGYILIAISVFVGGMLMAYARWGDAVLDPLVLAEDRDAKLLSIYAFFTDSRLLPSLGVDRTWLRRATLVVFACAGAIAFALHVAWRQYWFSGVVSPTSLFWFAFVSAIFSFICRSS